MSSLFDTLNNQDAVQFADKIGDPFKSLPNLPKGIVEFFVTITPYVALIAAFLMVILAPLGALGTVFAVLALDPMVGGLTLIATVIGFISGIILFMAFKPLRDREHKGWMFLFWSQILSIVSSVLSLVGGASIVGFVISTAIGLYLLYQMRPFYNPVAEVVSKTVKE